MRSAKHTPSAAAKRWMAWVASRGCLNCRAPANVHHCVGATARHNKVAIGDWWLLPLCRECHQGDHGIHGDRSRFFGAVPRKTTEKMMFARLMDWARADSACVDMPAQHAIDAIEDYRLRSEA